MRTQFARLVPVRTSRRIERRRNTRSKSVRVEGAPARLCEDGFILPRLEALGEAGALAPREQESTLCEESLLADLLDVAAIRTVFAAGVQDRDAGFAAGRHQRREPRQRGGRAGHSQGAALQNKVVLHIDDEERRAGGHAGLDGDADLFADLACGVDHVGQLGTRLVRGPRLEAAVRGRRRSAPAAGHSSALRMPAFISSTVARVAVDVEDAEADLLVEALLADLVEQVVVAVRHLEVELVDRAA